MPSSIKVQVANGTVLHCNNSYPSVMTGIITLFLQPWVYIEPIYGPLHTWAQYTPTPPRSLNYRRSGVQDWTTRKLTPPAV